LLDPWLATKRNGAVGDICSEIGPVPAGKMFGGLTVTTMLVLTGTERLPLLLLMSSSVTSLPAKSATYRKAPEVWGAMAEGFDPTGKFGVDSGSS